MRACLIFVLLFLSACGFQPIYAPARADDPVRRELAAIAIAELDGRLGFVITDTLRRALNPLNLSEPPRYRLEVVLVQDTDAVAIELDRTITRYNLELASVIVLRALEDNAPLYRTRLTRLASYDASIEPFAILAAERDAEERVVRELAQEIELLLSAYFAETRGNLS